MLSLRLTLSPGQNLDPTTGDQKNNLNASMLQADFKPAAHEPAAYTLRDKDGEFDGLAVVTFCGGEEAILRTAGNKFTRFLGFNFHWRRMASSTVFAEAPRRRMPSM